MTKPLGNVKRGLSSRISNTNLQNYNEEFAVLISRASMVNRIRSIVFLVLTMLSITARSFRMLSVGNGQVISRTNRAMMTMAATGEVQHMTATQFGGIIKGDNRSMYQIIDVREVDELAVASIKGADIINLPLGSAAEWSPKVEQGKLLDATKPTICMCKGGMRSMRVATLLVSQGFKEVYSVDGGINGYASTVEPTIPTY